MAANIIECNLKRDYQIFIAFARTKTDVTGHRMTVQVPTSPNVFFCTTWENKTSKMCVEINKKNVEKHPRYYRLYLEAGLSDFNSFC